METKTPSAFPPVSLFIKEGFSFFITNWKKILPYFAVLFAVQFVIAAVLLLAEGNVLVVSLFTVVSFFADIFVGYLVFSSDLWYQDIDTNTSGTVGGAYKKALSFFFPLVWVCLLSFSVLVTLLFLLVLLPIFGAGVLNGFLSVVGGNIGGVIGAVVLGIAVLFGLISFIACVLSVTFVSYTSLLEGKRGLAAVMQSFWYTKGRRKAFFVRYLIMTVLSGIVPLALILIAYSSLFLGYSFSDLMVMLEAENPSPFPLYFTLPILVVTFIATLVYYLLWASYSYIFWKHAKATAGTEEAQAEYQVVMRPKFKAMAIAGAVLAASLFVLGIVGAAVSSYFIAKMSAEQQAFIAETATTTLEQESF